MIFTLSKWNSDWQVCCLTLTFIQAPVMRLSKNTKLCTQYVLISRYQPLLKVTRNYHKCSANITERHPVFVKGYHSLGPHRRNPLAFPPPRTQLMVIALKPCPHCFWTISPTYSTAHAPPSRAVVHIPGLVKSQMSRVPAWHISSPVCSLQRQRGVPGISYM